MKKYGNLSHNPLLQYLIQQVYKTDSSCSTTATSTNTQVLILSFKTFASRPCHILEDSEYAVANNLNFMYPLNFIPKDFYSLDQLCTSTIYRAVSSNCNYHNVSIVLYPPRSLVGPCFFQVRFLCAFLMNMHLLLSVAEGKFEHLNSVRLF